MGTVRPRYGAGSLAEVIPAALAALGVPDGAAPGAPEGTPDPLGLAADLAEVRRIAVLLVDGLGHQQLPVAAPVAPTLADLAAGRLGTLRPITTGFPSTTPTSLVTVGAGVPPGTHGVLGFSLNVPGTPRVLNHIRWADDPDPRRWQPVPTQFARAAAAGVATTVVSRSAYAGSGLTVSAYHGAAYATADTPDELARRMLAVLGEGEPPVLVYGYHPDLDHAGHVHGVGSPQWLEAAVEVDRLLERLVNGLPADAALLVTADHGQLVVPADGHRFDLDADPRLREGVRVVAGEPRVRYLHVVPGAVADVIATWRGVLGEAAWVVSREEAVAEGWYGPVAADHLPRLGDVVVVCHDRYAVLASATEPQTVSELVGFHGSWTLEEMLVPLAVFRPAG